MALALGIGALHTHSLYMIYPCLSGMGLCIGSVFNHSEQPNVSFELEAKTESIRYTISRRIEAGEELFIFYGHKLWFEQHGQSSTTSTMVKSSDPDDGWGGLGAIDDSSTEEVNPFSEGNPNDVIPESELPFTRLKLVDDTEEDLPENIRTSTSFSSYSYHTRHTDVGG